jgi:phosphate transport system substrate-binding protein
VLFRSLIEGLTLANFPTMDGSTSTKPLIDLAAARLLGYKAGWERPAEVLTWDMTTNLPVGFKESKLLCSQTHGSIVNLIDGGTDMIFVARTLSDDEKAYAEQKGVTLIEKTIALDALVFMVCNGSRGGEPLRYVNPVNSLTHAQLEDIYTAKTKNWSEVGGDDLPMMPFVRNANSGSQELMESLVMTEPIPDGFYEDRYEDFQIIPSMVPVFSSIESEPGGLGYTVYYFKENMVRDQFHVKTIAVNGISPNKTTIGNRTYPFTAEVYLMIRDDLDRGSMAWKVYEAMFTAGGRRIVAESGYVPVD